MMEIILEEHVSIENIKDFYRLITDALDNESEIIIDFSRLKNADLSLKLVLLTSMRRAKKRNISMKMTNLSESMRHFIENKKAGGGVKQWAEF